MSNGRSRERAQDVWVRGGGVYLLGPDGEPLTSVPVEFDMSSALPVTLSGSKVEQLLTNTERIAPGISHRQVVQAAFDSTEFTSTTTVFETTDPCRIDALTFAADNSRARLNININDEAGQELDRLKFPRYDGTGWLELEPVWVQTRAGGETALWKITNYNSEAPTNPIMILKEGRYIDMPTGGRVSLSSAEWGHGVAIEMLVSFYDQAEVV